MDDRREGIIVDSIFESSCYDIEDRNDLMDKRNLALRNFICSKKENLIKYDER